MKLLIRIFALFICVLLFNSIKAIPDNFTQYTAVVCIPVADIRDQDPDTKMITPFVLPENSQDKPFFFADNKFQETQVLFGETVKVIDENEEWALVDTLEQKHYNSNNTLIPCQGWINKNAIIKKDSITKTNLTVTSLWAPIYCKNEQDEIKFNASIGTKLNGRQNKDGSWKILLPEGIGTVGDEHVQKIIKKNESVKDLRVDLVERAKLFITSPYNWGGSSAPAKFYPDPLPENMKHQAAGVDCSGLVYILFKSFGFICPRNSNDQYLFSTKIDSGSKMSPGDLIFFAKVGEDKKTPLRVTHVAIYAGKDEQNNTLIIESQGVSEPYVVRLIQTTKMARLGNKQIADIKTGDIFEWFDERNKITCLSYIYLGSFINSKQLKTMRKDFITPLLA